MSRIAERAWIITAGFLIIPRRNASSTSSRTQISFAFVDVAANFLENFMMYLLAGWLS
jgi:hypothetical protein